MNILSSNFYVILVAQGLYFGILIQEEVDLYCFNFHEISILSLCILLELQFTYLDLISI